MKGIINSKPIYNFNELQGKLTHTQVDSINADTITTGILDTNQGGTGTNQKDRIILQNLGITTKEGTTIRVALDGSGDFTSINAAIQSLPKLLNHTIHICVAPGTYKENVQILGFYGPGMINLTTEYTDLVSANTLGPVIIDGTVLIKSCTSYIRVGCNLAPDATYPYPFFRIHYTSDEVPSANVLLLAAERATHVQCQYVEFRGNPIANYAANANTDLKKIYGIYATINSYVYVTACAFYSLYHATYSAYGAHLVLNNSVGGQGTGTTAISSTNNQNKYAGYATYGGKITFIKGAIPGSNSTPRPYAHTSNGGHIVGTTNGTVTNQFA